MVRIRIIRRRTIYLAVAATLAILGLLVAWALTNRPGAGAYFPLPSGSWWIYRSEDSPQASYRQDVLYRRGDLVQIRVDSGSATQMKVYAVGRNAITLVYSADVQDDRTPNYLDSPANVNRVLIKSPVKPGAKWVSDGWLHEVVATGARVETPAGVFEDCVKVRAVSPDGTATVYRYHKKGIGIVRTEHVSQGRVVVTELEDFRIKT
jgi:hypothetical protein